MFLMFETTERPKRNPSRHGRRTDDDEYRNKAPPGGYTSHMTDVTLGGSKSRKKLPSVAESKIQCTKKGENIGVLMRMGC